MDNSENTILIVEDEQNLADLFGEWLEREHEVIVAYDGETALDKFSNEVDVVLLDRRMPNMSGDEVLDRIQAQKIDCTVAMVTAVDPDYDIIEMGFDDYITKPVSKDELRSFVEQLLTLPSYEKTVQRYFQLSSKIAALESVKSKSDLEENEEYLSLVEELEEVKTEADNAILDITEENDATSLFEHF